eukprot:1692632-Pyramimonas_sp.AAC.1
MEACHSGNSAEAARLIRQGACVHARDPTRRTALMYAAGSCREAVPLLLRASADASARNSSGGGRSAMDSRGRGAGRPCKSAETFDPYPRRSAI